MIIKTNIYSELKINTLEDLHKLKPIMEVNNLKVNKSQIARELGVGLMSISWTQKVKLFYAALLTNNSH